MINHNILISHTGCRRGEDHRDRHRQREHNLNRDRDVREREHRDIRDRDRDPRAAGRDIDPRTGRYEAERDRSFRPPSRQDGFSFTTCPLCLLCWPLTVLSRAISKLPRLFHSGFAVCLNARRSMHGISLCI